MKKRILILLVAVLFIQVSVYAQRIRKNSLGRLTYTQLPSDPFPSNFKDYKVKGTGAHNDLYRRDAIVNGINIVGFNKVNSEDYQFLLDVEEYPLQHSEAERKENVVKKKKDGIVRTYTYYNYVSSVVFKYNLVVKDKEGNELFRRVFEGEEDIVGPEDRSISKAHKDYKATKKKFIKEILSSQVKAISEYVNNRVGFPKKAYFLRVYVVKPKKYNYDEYTKAAEIFSSACDILKADENKTEEALNILKPAIEAWKTELKESDLEHRRARINKKVTCGTLYNIALSYMICKDYTKAIEYFNKCTAINSIFGNARSFIDIASNLQQRVEANKK
ncbi:MAG: tetratricopeptide repeat protein [Bacteroidales bacterium]|nr:tetratricopeptide repeat protein [Bacteroidales bacterium]